MFPTPQDEIQMRGQVEYAKEKIKELPERKPGDKYPLFGVIIGIIAGIIVGTKTWNGNFFWLVGCVIAGGIIGTSLGSLVGTLITKLGRPKNNLRYY